MKVLLDYEYYLPRIDKLYLNTKEEFIVRKGVSARYPKLHKKQDLLEIAQIHIQHIFIILRMRYSS